MPFFLHQLLPSFKCRLVKILRCMAPLHRVGKVAWFLVSKMEVAHWSFDNSWRFGFWYSYCFVMFSICAESDRHYIFVTELLFSSQKTEAFVSVLISQIVEMPMATKIHELHETSYKLGECKWNPSRALVRKTTFIISTWINLLESLIIYYISPHRLIVICERGY